jgi:pimeloyl-ACP methyl ester carboxylesterase
MYAFDLPAHGRSYLGSKQVLESSALTETVNLVVIKHLINRIDLRDAVVCGASMAGHVCLAWAIEARQLGIRGSILCENFEHSPPTQRLYSMTSVEASLLGPERVSGMIAPTWPEYYKRQIWWQYSSQD